MTITKSQINEDDQVTNRLHITKNILQDGKEVFIFKDFKLIVRRFNEKEEDLQALDLQPKIEIINRQLEMAEFSKITVSGQCILVEDDGSLYLISFINQLKVNIYN